MDLNIFLLEVKLIRSFLKTGIAFESSLKIISEKFPNSLFSKVYNLSLKTSLEESFQVVLNEEKNLKIKDCLKRIVDGIKVGDIGRTLDLIIDRFDSEAKEEIEKKNDKIKIYFFFFLLISIIAPLVLFVFFGLILTLQSLEFLGVNFGFVEEQIFVFILPIFLVQSSILYLAFRTWY